MKGGSSHGSVRDLIDLFEIDRTHFTGQRWSRGRSKLDTPSIAEAAKKISSRMKGRVGHPHSLATRQKLSDRASERNFTNGCIKTKWHDVFNPALGSNIKVQGTWELAFAEWLNRNQITWMRPRNTFSWKGDGESIEHRYHPDFYLPETDEYVEIKGYMWKDDARGLDDALKLERVIAQNPQLTLTILMKSQLTTLGILNRNHHE